MSWRKTLGLPLEGRPCHMLHTVIILEVQWPLQVQGLVDSGSGLETGLKDLFQEIYKSCCDRDFIEKVSQWLLPGPPLAPEPGTPKDWH